MAQVLEVSETGDTAIIKVIPRLDLAKDSFKRKSLVDIKHPQKLFNRNQVNKREITTTQGFFYSNKAATFIKVKLLTRTGTWKKNSRFCLWKQKI